MSVTRDAYVKAPGTLSLKNYFRVRKFNNRTKSDSSTRAENAKAIGEQHLRNSAKCPCNFGRSGTGDVKSPVSQNWRKRLFIKNVRLC